MSSHSHEEKEAIQRRLASYRWYHRIQVAEGVWTLSVEQARDNQPIWDLILRGLDQVDFRDKRVLDVGCRDGLFALEAEKRGAAEVIGIDNDLSPGATEFLLPFLGSAVQMFPMNVYDLQVEEVGYFEIILLLGVLYHLRHPTWALKKLVDCLSCSGFLAVEGIMLADPRYEDHSLLHCPGMSEEQFGDWTLCSIFNRKGLVATLFSMGCRLVCASALDLEPPGNPVGLPRTNRQFLLFEKDATIASMEEIVWMDKYWHGTHAYHTTGTTE